MSFAAVDPSDPLPRPGALRANWKLNQEDLIKAREDGQLEPWDVCSLSEKQVQWQFAEYERLLQDQELSFQAQGKPSAQETGGTSTLSSLATIEVLRFLASSEDILKNVRTVVRNTNALTVREILRDPRTPYVVLRAFLALAHQDEQTAIDIDECVLANECYIRTRGYERNKDGWGLVTLEDAGVLFDKQHRENDDGPLVVTRKDPPKGGLQVLDSKRPRHLALHPTTEAFIATFNRITRQILQGLDWDHVLVAGGLVLTTLLHTKPEEDDNKKVRDGDIDIYLYGLNPSEANEKVREIFRVWKSNLPPENQQILVIKNAKTITFLSDYPNRRIQIVLKLVSSPTAVLLNFDLDPCAMGFDGKNVLMLPRCARALETGYSTFTCDLVWGHALGDRRASQDQRLFKYADRGFGVRILPSYIRSLERQTDVTEEQLVEVSDEEPLTSRYHKYRVRPRRPSGEEPGLKTLKRIMLLASDFVNRFYFGLTDLSDKDVYEGPEDWNEILRSRERADAIKENIRRQYANGQSAEVPAISTSELDGRLMHRSLPRRRGALGCFELWMRHCEAWRLDAVGEAALLRTQTAAVDYDVNDYDDLPAYSWKEGFKTSDFVGLIEEHNNRLFSTMRYAICNRLEMDWQATGWKDYLTRRIRRVVYGSDIDVIFEKQITLPIIIPHDLEQTFQDLFLTAIEERDPSATASQDRLLIPVHNQGQGTEIIPDLVDEAGLRGNVRYWIIGNDVMWAGLDRRIDEIFEVLWTFFHWANLTGNREVMPSVLGDSDHLLFFASRFRDRLALFDTELSKSVGPVKLGELSQREAALFAAWTLQRPVLSRSAWEANYNIPDGMTEEFNESVKYPPPDDMFWDPSEQDDGANHQWIDVVPGGDGSPSEEEESALKRKRDSSQSIA